MNIPTFQKTTIQGAALVGAATVLAAFGRLTMDQLSAAYFGGLTLILMREAPSQVSGPLPENKGAPAVETKEVK